jgi:hypothetical protein
MLRISRSLKSTGLEIGHGLWETVGMSKTKTPKPKTSLTKRTPDQAAHTAAKKRKQQADRAQQTFIDNLVGDLERRTTEDFSQATGRIA